MVAGHLPTAVDAAPRSVWAEGHPLDVLWACLEIIERGRGPHGIAKGGMVGDILHQLAVNVDGAAVLEGLYVIGTRLAGPHGRLPCRLHPASPDRRRSCELGGSLRTAHLTLDRNSGSPAAGSRFSI